jgi:hypothetical protein
MLKQELAHAVLAPNFDHVASLSPDNMNNGACGRWINIHVNGASYEARVFDSCPDCAEGDAEVRKGFFKEMVPEGRRGGRGGRGGVGVGVGVGMFGWWDG